jgi:hypothetical protein
MVVLLAVSIAGATVLAQQKPDYDMGKMQMLFLDQSPEWKTGDHRRRDSQEASRLLLKV